MSADNGEGVRLSAFAAAWLACAALARGQATDSELTQRKDAEAQRGFEHVPGSPFIHSVDAIFQAQVCPFAVFASLRLGAFAFFSPWLLQPENTSPD